MLNKQMVTINGTNISTTPCVCLIHALSIPTTELCTHTLMRTVPTLASGLIVSMLLSAVPAGQTLAASYPAAVESLPPAAEELRSSLGGLGGAGEAGLQSLAKVAAGKTFICWIDCI